MTRTFQANAFQANAVQPDTIFAGFVVSEERTVGGTLTPAAINVTGGLVRSEERTFGGAITEALLHTDLHVRFPIPGESLITGSGLQQFKVLVRKVGPGGNPSVSLELWYWNGGTRSKLSDLLTAQVVSNTTSEIVLGYFDAAILPNLTGSGVELRVVGVAVTGGWVEIGAVRWNFTGITQQMISGFLRTEERAYGGTLTIADIPIVGGLARSEERMFAGAMSLPTINGGFTGGLLTPGDYPPGDYPPSVDQERTFGGTLSVTTDDRLRISPTAILTMSGVSGDVGDISDDPDNPDQNFLVAG